MSVHRLGPYSLLRRAGHGATGVVWEAVDAVGRQVAVKLVHAHGHADDVRRELLTHASLRHPQLVELLDAGEVPPEGLDDTPGGTPFLVTEWATGTLRDGITSADLVEVLDDILAGLAYLHARGLVHGDLKPSNVLRIEGGDRLKRWVLADFGIAHAAGTEALGGTLRYLAPEAFGARARPGPAADLYAAGVIGWMLATGHSPHQTTERSDWARVHRQGVLPPFDPVVPVPEGLASWLGRLLAPSPDARVAHAADARHELRSLASPSGAAAVLPEADDETLFTAPQASLAVPMPPPSRTTEPSATHPRPRPFPRPEEITSHRGKARARTSALAPLRSPDFVGRDHELQILWAELERADAEARVVHVHGPGGIGATALVDAFATRAAELGAAVRVDDLTDGGGLGAGLARALHVHPLDEAELDDRLAHLLPRRSRAERAGLRREIQGEGHASDGAWQAVLAALARGRRLLWILDDAAHQPHDAARMQAMAPQGVLRVLVRPGAEIGPPSRRLDLAPLGPQSTADLVESLLPVGPGTVVSLVQRAQGHPATATALALAAIGPAGEVDRTTVERASLASAADATLSRARATARAAGADPAHLLHAAALYDPTIPSFLCVWGAPPSALARLEREGLARRRGEALWLHPLLVDASRSSLSSDDHRRILSRLGEDAPAATRAWHQHRSHAPEPAAATWLTHAQGLANRGRVHAQLAALDEAERSLRVLGPDAPGWSTLWQLRAHGLALRGDRDGSEAAAQRALATACTPTDQVQARRRLAVARSRLRDLDGATELLREALTFPAPDELLALAAIDLGSIRTRQGSAEEARSLLEALNPSQLAPQVRASYAVLHKQIDRHTVGFSQQTLARLDVALSDDLDHPLWRGILLSERGDVLQELGSLDAASDSFTAGERQLEQAGAEVFSIAAGCNRCQALCLAGRASEAAPALASLVQRARATPAGGTLQIALSVRALTHGLLGALHDARGDLAEVRTLIEATAPDRDIDRTLLRLRELVPTLAPDVDNVRQSWSADAS